MRVRIVKLRVGQISAQMPNTPANTPRSMKAHQISPSLTLTRLCIPAARDPRGSFRSFIVNFLAALPGVYTFLLKDLIRASEGDSIYNGSAAVDQAVLNVVSRL
jgi:hypothetical protein